MAVFAFIVGFFVTIQAGLNRQLSSAWGLASALLWTSIIVLFLSLTLYFSLRWNLWSAPDFFQNKEPFQKWYWWVILPGVCGFMIIFGLPWAITYLGATKTIVLCIGGQIISSILWDWLVEKAPINSWRLIGGLMTFVGAFLVTYK